MRRVRFACAWIRNFALELWFAQRPEKRRAAVALADSPDDSAVIRQISDPAATAGIRPGMTLAQAHARCADLQAIVIADIPVPSKSQQLLLHLQNLSPQVEARAPGLYLLGVSGLQRLYGSEANFARMVIAAVQSHALPVSVGVADTGAAARIAAAVSAPDTFTVIPPGAHDASQHPWLLIFSSRARAPQNNSQHSGCRRSHRLPGSPRGNWCVVSGPRERGFAGWRAGEKTPRFHPRHFQRKGRGRLRFHSRLSVCR